MASVGFGEVTRNTWDELVENLKVLEPGWIFRGQRSHPGDLRTSLERHTPARLTPPEAEPRLRLEFERRAYRYLSSSELPQNSVEWLALMQHFGAPTRLLDFTHSPYVAAYFAFEDPVDSKNDHHSIWAVNARWCRRKAGELIRRQLHDIEEEIDRLLSARPSLTGMNRDELATHVAGQSPWFDNGILSNGCALVTMVEPFRLAERTTLQQGTFLCPGDVGRTFMDNLAVMEASDDQVRHLKVKGGVRDSALHQLRLMNITRATLFPGLEGFAQSFRQMLVEEAPEIRHGRLATHDVRIAASSPWRKSPGLRAHRASTAEDTETTEKPSETPRPLCALWFLLRGLAGRADLHHGLLGNAFSKAAGTSLPWPEPKLVPRSLTHLRT